MYPTIAMSARADNLALKAEFIDGGLEFVNAKYVVMKSSDGASINVDTLDFAPGVRPDGRLDWKGRTEQWILAKQGDTLAFSFENGERIARDQDGNIVEPQIKTPSCSEHVVPISSDTITQPGRTKDLETVFSLRGQERRFGPFPTRLLP
jgi:hypothetical protein